MSLQYLIPDDEYMEPIEEYSPEESKDLEYTPSSNRNDTSKSFSSPRQSNSKNNTYQYSDVSNSKLRQSSSKHILANILEQNWSTNSPSRKKKKKMLEKSVNSSRYIEKSTTRGNVDYINAMKFSNFHNDSQPFVEKAEQLRKSYENIKNAEFSGIENLSTEEKVMKYLEHLEDHTKDVKFAALNGLHSLLENKLSSSVIEIILDELLSILEKWEELDDDYLEYTLDIIGSIGPHTLSIDKLQTMLSILFHDETSNNESLHSAAFSCIFRLGFAGVECLVKLASKDYSYLQSWILEKLAVTSLIQKNIIVPALAQDALSSNPQVKLQAIAALNRMYSVVWEGGALPVLLTLMEEGSVDRPLIACTIRACGLIGEQTLIKLLKQSSSGKIRMACAGALCWRLPVRPRQIEIKVVNESIKFENSLTPGSMWKYIGPCVPVVQDQGQDCVLEIYARDLLASLQRWIRKENKISTGEVFPLLPTIPVINDTSVEEEQEISSNVIKNLCSALKDLHPGVRETATYSIGFIGLPEACEAIGPLIKVLKDPSPQIRTMATWAIGRLGTDSIRAIPELLSLLKDEYWKVRSAACISIASAGQPAAGISLPVLAKILKEGSINRATVAETMVRLGPQGEKLVIEIMKKEPLSNIILRVAAIKALSHANINNNNIDYVIETLYKVSTEKIPQIRKEALLAMKSISERAGNKLTYLKPKTLLPLYINYLKDPCKEIRDICVNCIMAIGPQGELTMIEALMKDSNHIIRAEAAKGLGSLGPSSFRTLILGLSDTHPHVRESVASTIYKNFTAESLNREYLGKASQRQSLRCAIKEVLSLPHPILLRCSNLLKDFLSILETECKNKENYTD
jgi:HEAT repeat protein